MPQCRPREARGPEGDRVIPGKENDPTLSCFPDGIPKILTSPEPFEIITVPGRVLMFFEKDHGWRQIWTDGRKLSDDPPELRFDGYSVGRWEGDTFIVDSNGFNDKLWLDYYGDPHSEQLHLTERYQRPGQGHVVDSGHDQRPEGLHETVGRQANTVLVAAACGNRGVVLHDRGRKPVQREDTASDLRWRRKQEVVT
jgi:hypothetical protein